MCRFRQPPSHFAATRRACPSQHAISPDQSILFARLHWRYSHKGKLSERDGVHGGQAKSGMSASSSDLFSWCEDLDLNFQTRTWCGCGAVTIGRKMERQLRWKECGTNRRHTRLIETAARPRLRHPGGEGKILESRNCDHDSHVPIATHDYVKTTSGALRNGETGEGRGDRNNFSAKTRIRLSPIRNNRVTKTANIPDILAAWKRYSHPCSPTR